MKSENLRFCELLKQFLLKPEIHFELFYSSCKSKAITYLRSRNHQRFNRSLSDLAHDAIVEIFVDNSGRGPLKIYRYFRSKGITDFEIAEPKELETLFWPFFYKQLSQSTSEICNERRSVFSPLVKTVQNIIGGREFKRVTGLNGFICKAEDLNKLRYRAKPVSRQIILNLVSSSLNTTTTVADLCRKFFRELEGETEYQNFVRRRELVSAIVEIWETFIIDRLPKPLSVGPDTVYDFNRAKIAAQLALERVDLKEIQRLLNQKRIEFFEAEYLREMCRLYLEDRVIGNGMDPNAEYFRSSHPEKFHHDYDTVYKYRVLRILSLAEKFYIEELHNLV